MVAITTGLKARIMSDAQLKTNALDELSWDPTVDEDRISVAVKDGIVTLTGRVPTYLEKLNASKAVRRVVGARSIKNEIDVKLPKEFHRDDADIAERISTILEWNISVPSDNVEFAVKDGHVTLSGEVDWDYQKREFERLIEPVRYVSGVTNTITLKPRPIAKDLQKKITDALTRNAIREAENVKVSIDGDTVTLEGVVHSEYERELIDKATWSAPGIKRVVDNLSIK